MISINEVKSVVLKKKVYARWRVVSAYFTVVMGFIFMLIGLQQAFL